MREPRANNAREARNRPRDKEAPSPRTTEPPRRLQKKRQTMSTVLIEKEKPAVSPNWMEAAERICAVISQEAAQHDADDSFVARGYELLKAEGFFKVCVPV